MHNGLSSWPVLFYTMTNIELDGKNQLCITYLHAYHIVTGFGFWRGTPVSSHLHTCKHTRNACIKCITVSPWQTVALEFQDRNYPGPIHGITFFSQIKILYFCSVQLLCMKASSYCHRLRHTVCLHIHDPSTHKSVTTVITNTQYKQINTTNTVNISSHHHRNVISQLNYNDTHFKICSSSGTGSTIFLLYPISLPNTCTT